jgi:hypothetical protein
MREVAFFAESGLVASDLIVFAKAAQLFSRSKGRKSCWSLAASPRVMFSGFINSKRNHLHYKAQDARPLLLALLGQYPSAGQSVIVRRHTCTDPFCLNPSHYYYGTRADVMFENQQRKGLQIDPVILSSIKTADSHISTKHLAEELGLPYHKVQKIRSGTTYRSVHLDGEQPNVEESWDYFENLVANLLTSYPEEVRRYQLEYHVTNELECPWHRNGETGHKGRFGHMGECLDCIEQIKEGHCSVDVTQFDYRWYWTVKRFWDQVDVKGEDECWPWLGATKKGGTESVAYCPSPFHNSPSQSAMRVAFWLSRGYTGKYRIHTKPDCEKFCCNPKHLIAKGLDGVSEPPKIETIQLNYVNIFEHFKKTNSQES